RVALVVDRARDVELVVRGVGEPIEVARPGDEQGLDEVALLAPSAPLARGPTTSVLTSGASGGAAVAAARPLASGGGVSSRGGVPPGVAAAAVFVVAAAARDESPADEQRAHPVKKNRTHREPTLRGCRRRTAARRPAEEVDGDRVPQPLDYLGRLVPERRGN